MPSRHLLALLTAAALASQAAASPRDELLRFVPDDVGFCLVVRDLRGHSADFLASPFAQAFAKTPLADALAGTREWRQLGEAEKYFRQHLGVGWKEAREDLLGEAVVVAYRPGPAGRPEQEQGAFLVRSREAKSLADFVARLDALQRRSGELKASARARHKGVEYVRREEKNVTNYYLLRGPVLVFSGQEAFLKELIERDLSLAKDAEPPLTARLRALALDRTFAALLVRPRTFDAALTEKDDPAAKAVARAWAALDDVGLGLTLGREIELSLVAKGKPDRLPPALRRLASAATKASDLWTAFPEDALFAAAGRLDAAALYEAWAGLLPKASRAEADAELERTFGAMLGKEFVKEVLPALGPDVGVCVTSPGKGKRWVPGVVAAVRVQRGGEDEPTDEAVFSAAESWAQLFVVNHNKQTPDKTLRLRTQYVDKVKSRYLEGEAALPTGVRPAFGLRHGYLVAATTPEELRRFEVKANKATAVPLARASGRALREYLAEHRAPLAKALAARDGVSEEEAGKRLDGLRAAVALVDRAELRLRADGERTTLTLAVVPAAK